MNTSCVTPSTPPRKQLTRDQRVAVKALYNAGHSQAFISQQLGITCRQVGIAINSDSLSPIRRGRQSKLSHQQAKQIESYILASRLRRRMSYKGLADGLFAEWKISQYMIARALAKLGYSRCIARSKPPLYRKQKNSKELG